MEAEKIQEYLEILLNVQKEQYLQNELMSKLINTRDSLGVPKRFNPPKRDKAYGGYKDTMLPASAIGAIVMAVISSFVNFKMIDNNGFFRKKTSHGYDGSNIMNLLELVYGGENIANLITGFDLSEEERKSIIPIKELHKLNEMIDSNAVLNQEEVNIFKNLKPPYMKTPNITGLILYYISESMKQDKLEDKNAYLQKMLDVLTRAYSVSFNYKIENCNSYDELMNIYNELSKIQNSIIWHKNLDIMNSLESYKNFEKLRESFISKLTQLNINNKDFASLYLGPSEMLEKFKLEESMIQKESINNKVTR